MNNERPPLKRVARAQCLVHREDRILLVRMHLPGEAHDFLILPGGGIEPGETPEEGAVRELREECRIEGTVVKKVQTTDCTQNTSVYDYYHTFLMDIGDQEPVLGSDPDYEDQCLIDVGWYKLAEISERDRASLISSGLMTIEEFRREILSWGDDISYPDFSTF